MSKPTPEQAAIELRAIQDLVKHPGWAVLCARHAKGVEDLTAAVLDVTKPDEIATRLRHTRAAVVELSPQVIADGLEKVLTGQLKRHAEKAGLATDGAKEAG
jgi:hypothetical protein